MTKRQAGNYIRLANTLAPYGVIDAELDSLLRAERTLRRWATAECNGDIFRDEKTGKPIQYLHHLRLLDPHDPRYYRPIADRETAALARAERIAQAHGLTAYHQTDCRGCMLYLIRPGDIPAGQDVGAYYTRGVAICI